MIINSETKLTLEELRTERDTTCCAVRLGKKWYVSGINETELGEWLHLTEYEGFAQCIAAKRVANDYLERVKSIISNMQLNTKNPEMISLQLKEP